MESELKKESKGKFLKNIKSALILTSGVGLFCLGYYLSEIARLTGTNLDPHQKGQNVKISGSCSVRNSGEITLTNDQVKLTSIKKETIEGVLISEAKYVTCHKSRIVLEGYVMTDAILGKTEIKQMTEKQVRDVERNPVYEYEKTTVLVSAICSTSSGKSVSITNRLMDVLSIREEQDGVQKIKGILIGDNQSVSCSSDNFKARKIDENDLESFIALEKKSLKGPESSSFLGKNLKVTGLCVIIDPTKKKKGLINLVEKTVKVTSEISKNNTITRITASSLGKSGQPVTIECNKESTEGIYWEETENQITSDSQETESSSSSLISEGTIKVTGSCSLEDGKLIALYEQTIKVSSKKEKGGDISSVLGFLKKDESILKINCDKAKDKSLVFDKLVKNEE